MRQKMKRTTLLITLGLSLLAVALVGLIMTTRVVALPAAPTFTVNSVFDSPADLSDTIYSVCRTAAANTTCTLRAAIMKANRYPGGGVTIIVPSGAYTIALAPSGEDDETTGDLNITQTMTIVGAGAAHSIVDGGSVDRVFRIGSGATVTLTGITIRHGLEQYGFPVSSPLFEGGGIYNEGLLTLNSTVITENLGYASGGGISNFGTLMVTNSLIADNALTAGGSNAGGLLNEGIATLNNTSVTANYALFDGGIGNGGTLVLNNVTVSANISYGGGAISNQGGTLTLNNSTISGNNSAGGIYNASTLVLNNVTISANTNTYYGGGITNVSPGTLTMNNSTISANSTTGSGGAIANSGTTRLFHVTIAGNLADRDAVGGNRTGGGISNTLGTVELWNTIVAENFHGSIADDCAGDPITSQDYNYIQTTAGCSIGGPATHNVYGGDALLGPLQNNGGATETRALWVGSPALDQIPSAQCRDSYATAPQPDQRGVARPINGLCDIGAFEGAQPTPLFNRNLIRNGNAENSAGSTAGAFVGTANWTNALGQFTAVPYNAPGGFPVLTDTIPIDHGYNFFSGGNVASSFGTQMVTVTAISTTIDTGLVKYALSGDFGGYATQEDYARLTLFFIDGIGGLIGSNQIGDVTAAQRANATGLLHRSANGIVPIGTRTIIIRASMYRVSAGVSNDGYADNLSLVLKPLSVYLPLILR
jgi:hypothetical protein